MTAVIKAVNTVQAVPETTNAVRKSVSGPGFWSAVLTAVFATAFAVVGIATPARSGPFAQPANLVPYPYTDVAAFIPDDYLWLYPGFLLALVFVVLMACIHAYATADKKVFSQIGLAFALLYAGIITTDYFIQVIVVQPSLLSGETAGLSLFTQYNPHGIFIALEGIGYLMMNGAFLFAGAVFSGGKLERALRRLFTTSFLLAIVSFIGLSLLKHDIVAFEVTVLSINWIVLIASGLILSVLFKRSGRYGSSRMPESRPN